MLESTKFINLRKAQKSGISIPETLFLNEKVLQSRTFEILVKNFLGKHKSNFYIIRSCIAGEDGNQKSFAGYFKSSKKLKFSEILENIEKYFEKNKKIQKRIIPEGETHLILQIFIEADFGGVIFSRWKYFSHHFLCEISTEGAEKTVEGRDSDFFLFSKNNKFKNLKFPQKKYHTSYFQNKLRIESLNFSSNQRDLADIILKLENIFDFPMDIEWCVKNNEIIILQIRPVTSDIQALKEPSEKEILKEKEFLAKPFDWQINDFAETFGVISPLSFEIIKSCFKKNLKIYQRLGFKAQGFNFLKRARNGQVYASPKLQKEFFKFKSFFSSFWQKINEKRYLEEILKFSEKSEINLKNSNFGLKNLIKIFGFWNICNVYAQQEDKIFLDENFLNEYEVLNILNIKFPKLKKNKSIKNKFYKKHSWAALRNFYKKLWLYEYDKLKKIIQKNPNLVFSDIFELKEILKNNSEKIFKKLKINIFKKYKEEISFSILNFPTNFSEKRNKKEAKKICMVKSKMKNKKIFVVKNPNTFLGKFPQNCILVSPYFKNSWILEIDKFSGIILEQCGILSHSAIIAREKNITYFISWDKATEKFKTGDLFEIKKN